LLCTFQKPQIEELEEKLSSKKMYMEELQENEKLLYESFTDQLGENNKFADFLTKVFKKKIKRVKKAAEMEGGMYYRVPWSGLLCDPKCKTPTSRKYDYQISTN
jgi:uncharacterized coiled-coil protein SlyX